MKLSEGAGNQESIINAADDIIFLIRALNTEGSNDGGKTLSFDCRFAADAIELLLNISIIDSSLEIMLQNNIVRAIAGLF